MSKESAVASPSIFQQLLQVGLYKKSQGRVARQVTFAAIALVVFLAGWSLLSLGSGWFSMVRIRSDAAILSARWGLATAWCLAGWWIAYRIVNYPPFADFLIAVEAEMSKVSWPTRTELVRSSIVVIFVMFFLALVLFIYDASWVLIFKGLDGWVGGRPLEM